MKLFKIVVFAALAMVSSVSVQAAVVMSNMGAGGLDDTSSNLASDITNSTRFATGFTTGSVAQTLDWVSLVVFNNDSGSKSVSLFSNSAGSPGVSLATSTGTAVNGKGVYTFNFGPGTNLAANTSYWILPEVGLKWYRATSDADPTAQNSSGFIYAGADKRSQDSGATWDDRTQNYTISVSSTDDVGPPPPPAAVPEPALTSLLCLSGIALIRRRMNK
jgi:hypothetical protein